MDNKRFLVEFRYKLENGSPLHIGTEDSQLLIQRQTGKALIPGTSMAGVLRSYLEKSNDKEVVAKLFGSSEGLTRNSLLFVHDLVSTEPAKFEQRTSINVDNKLGTARNGSLFNRQFIAPGLIFEGKMSFSVSHEDEKESYLNLLEQAFNALHHGIIRLGAYTSIGAGIFKVSDLRSKTYNLLHLADYFSFLAHPYETINASSNDKEWGNPLDSWLVKESKSKYYELTLNMTLSTATLIGSKATLSDYNVVPYQNEKGDYVIPGSSLKGVIRHQSEKIAHYYGRDTLIEFGFGSENDDTKKANLLSSSLKFFDAIIKDETGNKPSPVPYYGIHIDSLTGGTFDGALRSFQTVQGHCSLKIVLQENTDYEDKQQPLLAIVILALRDLAQQGITIGSGYANGRGIVQGKDLVISTPTSKVVIDFINEQVSDEALLQQLLNTLEMKEAAHA